MRNSFVKALAASAAVFFLFFSSTAKAADTGLNGFNIQTYHFTADGSGVTSLYGTQMQGRLKPTFDFALHGMGKLVEAGNPVNNQRIGLVDQMFYGDFSAALGIKEYLNVGIILPVIFYAGATDANTQQAFSYSGIGDILLDAKLRVLKDGKRSVGLGLLTRMSLPSGDGRQFAGWGTPTGEFRFLIDKNITPFYVTANLGYRIAPKTTVTNRISGVSWNVTDDDRLTFGVGGTYALPFQRRTWRIMASIYGESVIGDPKRMSTPIILDAGFEKGFQNGISLRVGGGRGLTNAIGSPSYHVFASVGFDVGGWKEARKNKEAAKCPKQLRGVIYFDSDSAALSSEGSETLLGLVKTINESSVCTIYIRGHTDSKESREYNNKLGLERARSVADQLIEHGLDAERIVVESYGETKPVDSNRTWEGRTRNRRVEIESGSE